MSLTTAHHILTTAGSSTYRVNMSTIQCLMISGRYRTEALCSHWSKSGSKFCTAPSCKGLNIVEDLDHILAFCGNLESTRQKLTEFTSNYIKKLGHPIVTEIVIKYCVSTNSLFCQFLVDCTSIPEVISATQIYGPDVQKSLLHITRVWCYCIHRDRLRTLGRWKKF